MKKEKYYLKKVKSCLNNFLLDFYLKYVNILTGDFMSRIWLNLPLLKKNMFLEKEFLKPIKYELEKIIDENKFMCSKNFSRSVLFYQEIKANNTIEGYNDNIEEVRYIIRHKTNSSDKEKRIINLYNGYKYILNEKEINKDNLKELYSLLSNGLLTKDEINRMGEYYRLDPVYIFYSSSVYKEPDQGIDSTLIDNYMGKFFEFVDQFSLGDTLTDEFIKSQIMHFYFVYIHPYYDINGRTSRTTSMWYLLNKKAYPYIIFNRAIQIHKPEYYKIIRETKKYSNITSFINYMMKNVKSELIKESILNSVNNNINLNYKEYQTLYYILSMNSNISVKDFTYFYNLYNDKIKTKEAYENMIQPLLNRKILLKDRDTKSNMYNNEKNFVFKINKDLYK